MKKTNHKPSLNVLRQEIQRTQMILIILITVFMSLGGASIILKLNQETINQNLQNTSELITRLYNFTRDYSQDQLCAYMDQVVQDLSDVDVVSIVDPQNNRIYHTHHDLINTQFDGTHPEFNNSRSYITDKTTGPSGPQLRTYSAIYDQQGQYKGFIMTIRLQKSIKQVTARILLMFLTVTLAAILIELAISRTISKKIKKQFLEFTEDFEGTKFLVDSMRANNHDFTNKLHVILGLIQIGQYEKAVSYIQNISIIQRETISAVMNAIDNPSFAALIIGKIARASECNVKFILKDNIHFSSQDIDIPSEALVTITGNLIDNALDAMNLSAQDQITRELTFGAFTLPGALLITVQDNGCGIPQANREKIFENGFSTKGTGRGVGLYHTKQLIESLGGTITFESQEGKGTCFMVNLKNRN